MIGITSIQQKNNNSLVGIDFVERAALVNDIPPLDRVTTLLHELCDEVVIYENDHPILSALSLSDKCIYIPSNIECDDWDILADDIKKALELPTPTIVTSSARFPDISRSYCKHQHFCPAVSDEQYYNTDVVDVYTFLSGRATKLQKLGYDWFSGIVIFIPDEVTDFLESVMPTLTTAIKEKKWDDVPLTFDQAVLENIPNWSVIKTETAITELKHYYQLYDYFNVEQTGGYPEWKVWNETAKFKISGKFASGGMMDLSPAVYYTDQYSIPDPTNFSKNVLDIKESTFAEFKIGNYIMKVE